MSWRDFVSGDPLRLRLYEPKREAAPGEPFPEALFKESYLLGWADTQLEWLAKWRKAGADRITYREAIELRKSHFTAVGVAITAPCSPRT